MAMKNSTLAIFTFMLLVITFSSSGQEKRLNSADESFDRYAYIDAQKIYLKVAQEGYQSADLFKKLGDSYYFNGDLKSAATWYEELYKNFEQDMSSEYFFRYAQSLKSTGAYEKADRTMEVFNEKVQSKERRAELFTKERNYLDMIEMQSGRFLLSDVGVNSSFSEFAPSFHDGSIVFSSSRSKPIKKVIHEWNERPFLDLFTAMPDNKKLIEVAKISGKVNTKFHESSTAFTSDGKTMYFTRNNYSDGRLKKDENGTTLLKLFRAKMVNNKWDDIEELPFNSDEYSVAHPALSADGSKLFFASDMPGGKGLSDLYVVDVKEDGSFGTPQNMGGVINTEGRETFPYVSNIGRLYFASDGHLGLGGLDVFVSVPGDNGFAKPVNVGEPVNSKSDDFTFILNEETKIGYFASNRPGGMGDDDIYSFVQIEELITTCKQTVVGVITDSKSTELLANTKVTLFDENMKELTEVVTDDSGRYQFTVDCDKTYVIRGAKDGYKSTEIEVVTDYQFEHENEVPLQLSSGSDLLKRIGVMVGDDLAKLLKLQPIYFDLDKAVIRPDAEIELQKVISAMKQYPELQVDIRSHTDSRASDSYNMRLSERRAKSTIKYIVDKGGVDKERITGRGYGESNLMNDCSNGASCTEAQHELNRRSEFIIIVK